MPVILTTPAEFDRWLEADTVDALTLQRPLPDDALRIVAKGEKEDRSPEIALRSTIRPGPAGITGCFFGAPSSNECCAPCHQARRRRLWIDNAPEWRDSTIARLPSLDGRRRNVP